MSSLCTLVFAGALAAGGPPAEAPRVLAMAYPVADLTDGDPAALGNLADALVAETGRDLWATFGGPGSVGLNPQNSALVIRQTRANHGRLAETLIDWRTVPPQIDVRVRIFGLPAGGAAADLWAAVGAGAADDPAARVLSGAAADRLAAAVVDRFGGRLVSRPRVTVLDGQEATVQLGEAVVTLPAPPAAAAPADGFALRVRAEADGEAVRLCPAAAFGPTAPDPAGPALTVPAGGAIAVLHGAADGPALLALLAPAVLPD